MGRLSASCQLTPVLVGGGWERRSAALPPALAGRPYPRPPTTADDSDRTGKPPPIGCVS